MFDAPVRTREVPMLAVCARHAADQATLPLRAFSGELGGATDHAERFRVVGETERASENPASGQAGQRETHSGVPHRVAGSNHRWLI